MNTVLLAHETAFCLALVSQYQDYLLWLYHPVTPDLGAELNIVDGFFFPPIDCQT